MSPFNHLRVLDAAEQVVDSVNSLIDNYPKRRRRLLYVAQLRDSAEGIGSNIAEGFGRLTPAEKVNKLRVSRGEAEETIRHLRANHAAGRIDKATFDPIKNRTVTIIKMIDGLIDFYN